MKKPALTAVKLETSDLRACELFFKHVFGFQVTHRYGGHVGDPFEEIVMTLGGEQDMKLKFIQFQGRPSSSVGATVQIVLDEIDEALAAAKAALATVRIEPTDYPEAKVRMAVITTDQGVDVELVQAL